MRGGRERPAYNAAYTVVFSANPTRGTPLPGGIYASPTNKGTAYTNQKRHHRANGHGGRERPPYKARYTPCKPQPGCPRVLSHRKPDFLSGRRPRSTLIFHFYFLIFNFLRFLILNCFFPFQHPVFPGGGAKRGFYTFSTGFSTVKPEKPNAGFCSRRAGCGSFPPFPPPLLRLRR